MSGAGGTSGGVPDFSLPEQRMEQRHAITAAARTLRPEKNPAGRKGGRVGVQSSTESWGLDLI